MSDLIEGGNLCFNIVLGGFVGGYPTKSDFWQLTRFMAWTCFDFWVRPHTLVGKKFSARSEKIARRRLNKI